jgi:hypothetical protein
MTEYNSKDNDADIAPECISSLLYPSHALRMRTREYQGAEVSSSPSPHFSIPVARLVIDRVIRHVHSCRDIQRKSRSSAYAFFSESVELTDVDASDALVAVGSMGASDFSVAIEEGDSVREWVRGYSLCAAN